MKNKMIKIIAWVLIAAFAAQDVVWANPEIFENRQVASTLQVPSFFQPIDARIDKQILEVTLKSILESAYELLKKEEFRYHLTPTVGNVLLDLEFDKARKEGEDIIVPCAASSDRSSRLYEAIIFPDKSVKLIQRSTDRTKRPDAKNNFLADIYTALNNNSKTMSNVSQYADLRSELAQKIGEGHEGEELLSVGIGSGILERELHEKWGVNITGIDINQELLDKVPKPIKTVAGSGDSLPFEEGQFDIVLMSESIGHLNLDKALSEASRVIKPGGNIHITTYSKDNAFLKWLGYATYDPGHLMSALAKAGFKDTEIVPVTGEHSEDFIYVKGSKPALTHPEPISQGMVKGRESIPSESVSAALSGKAYDVHLVKIDKETWAASSDKGSYEYKLEEASPQISEQYLAQLRRLFTDILSIGQIDKVVADFTSYEPHLRTVLLISKDGDKLAGAYCYDIDKNRMKGVTVSEEYKGAGAIDLLFEDMRTRLFNGDSETKLDGFIMRSSPRARQGYIKGTLGEIKLALGVNSHVTITDSGLEKTALIVKPDEKPESSDIAKEKTFSGGWEARIDVIRRILKEDPKLAKSPERLLKHIESKYPDILEDIPEKERLDELKDLVKNIKRKDKFTYLVIEARKHLVRAERAYSEGTYEVAAREYESSINTARQEVLNITRRLLAETIKDARKGLIRCRAKIIEYKKKLATAPSIYGFQEAFFELLWQRMEFTRIFWAKDLKDPPTAEDVKRLSNELRAYCESLISEYKKNREASGPGLFGDYIEMTLEQAFSTIDEFITEYANSLFVSQEMGKIEYDRLSAWEGLDVVFETEETDPRSELAALIAKAKDKPESSDMAKEKKAGKSWRIIKYRKWIAALGASLILASFDPNNSLYIGRSLAVPVFVVGVALVIVAAALYYRSLAPYDDSVTPKDHSRSLDAAIKHPAPTSEYAQKKDDPKDAASTVLREPTKPESTDMAKRKPKKLTAKQLKRGELIRGIIAKIIAKGKRPTASDITAVIKVLAKDSPDIEPLTYNQVMNSLYANDIDLGRSIDAEARIAQIKGITANFLALYEREPTLQEVVDLMNKESPFKEFTYDNLFKWFETHDIRPESIGIGKVPRGADVWLERIIAAAKQLSEENNSDKVLFSDIRVALGLKPAAFSNCLRRLREKGINFEDELKKINITVIYSQPAGRPKDSHPKKSPVKRAKKPAAQPTEPAAEPAQAEPSGTEQAQVKPAAIKPEEAKPAAAKQASIITDKFRTLTITPLSNTDFLRSYNGYKEQINSPKFIDILQYAVQVKDWKFTFTMIQRIEASGMNLSSEDRIHVYDATDALIVAIEKSKPEAPDMAKDKTSEEEDLSLSSNQLPGEMPKDGSIYASGVDTRPVKARLLHSAYVAYDMAQKEVINPDNKPLRGLYGGAGYDIGNFLLSTNARNSCFVSDYSVLRWGGLKILEDEDYLCGGYKKDITEEYRSNKYNFGYVGGDIIKIKLRKQDEYELRNIFEVRAAAYKPMIAQIAYELNSLGVKSVKVDTYNGSPKIIFRWSYYGAREEEYSITFVDADITNPKKYPEALRAFLEENLDVYYQRAGERIANSYSKRKNNFIGHINPYMNTGGFFVTDDFSPRFMSHLLFRKPIYADRSKNFPIPCKIISTDKIDKAKQEALWMRSRSFTGPDRGYGLVTTIRQADDPETVPEPKSFKVNESVIAVEKTSLNIPYWQNDLFELLNKIKTSGSKFTIGYTQGLWAPLYDKVCNQLIIAHIEKDGDSYKALPDYFEFRMDIGSAIGSRRLLYYPPDDAEPIPVNVPVAAEEELNTSLDTDSLIGFVKAALALSRSIFYFDSLLVGRRGRISAWLTGPDKSDASEVMAVARSVLPELNLNNSTGFKRHIPHGYIADLIVADKKNKIALIAEFGRHPAVIQAMKIAAALRTLLGLNHADGVKIKYLPKQIALYADGIEPGDHKYYDFSKEQREAVKRFIKTYRKVPGVSNNTMKAFLKKVQIVINNIVADLSKEPEILRQLPDRFIYIIDNAISIDGDNAKKHSVVLRFRKKGSTGYIVETKGFRVLSQFSSIQELLQKCNKTSQRINDLQRKRIGNGSGDNIKPAAPIAVKLPARTDAGEMPLSGAPQRVWIKPVVTMLLTAGIVFLLDFLTESFVFNNFEIGGTIRSFKDWLGIGNYAGQILASPSSLIIPLIGALCLPLVFTFIIYKYNTHLSAAKRRIWIITGLFIGVSITSIVNPMVFHYYHPNYFYIFGNQINFSDVAAFLGMGGFVLEFARMFRPKLTKIFSAIGAYSIFETIFWLRDAPAGGLFIIAGGILWWLFISDKRAAIKSVSSGFRGAHSRHALPESLLSPEEKAFNRQLELGRRYGLYGGGSRVFHHDNETGSPNDAESADIDSEIEAAISLAKLHMVRRDFRQALRYCEDGLKMRKEYKLLAFKGICIASLDAGSGNLAISCCNEAISMRRKDALAYCALIQVLGNLKEPSILYYFEETLNRARTNGVSPEGITRIERNIAKFSDKIDKLKTRIEKARLDLDDLKSEDHSDNLPGDRPALLTDGTTLHPFKPESTDIKKDRIGGKVPDSDKLASIREYYRPFSDDWQSTTAGIFAPTQFTKFVDLLRKLDVKPGMKLLDAGCGKGIILAIANAFGLEAVGYELDEKYLDICNTNLNKLSAQGAVDLNSTKVILGDYRDADLSEFDIVYMYWTPARVDGALLSAEEYAVYFKKFEEKLTQLKPGSRFVISGGPKELLSGLVGKNILTEDALTYIPFRVFTRTQTTAAVIQAGDDSGANAEPISELAAQAPLSFTARAFGEVLIPETFGSLREAKGSPKVHGSDILPDKVLKEILDGHIVILHGDFKGIRKISQQVSQEISRRQAASDDSKEERFSRRLDMKRRKRALLARLCVVANEDSLLKVKGQPELKDVLDKLEGDNSALRGKNYILPVNIVLTLNFALKRERRGFFVSALGRNIKVLHNVFSPSDSRLYQTIRDNIDVAGKTVIDACTGTGVIGLIALEKGAKHVVMTDINPACLKCAASNVEDFGYSQKAEVVYADLLREGDMADVIIINPPWMEAKPQKMLDLASYDEESRVITGLFQRAGAHLNPGGCIYLLYSNLSEISGDRRKHFLGHLIHDNGFEITQSWKVGNKKRNKNGEEEIFLYRIEPAPSTRSDTDGAPQKDGTSVTVYEKEAGDDRHPSGSPLGVFNLLLNEDRPLNIAEICSTLNRKHSVIQRDIYILVYHLGLIKEAPDLLYSLTKEARERARQIISVLVKAQDDYGYRPNVSQLSSIKPEIDIILEGPEDSAINLWEELEGKTFGETIKYLRIRDGWGFVEFARYSGIGQTTLSRIENNRICSIPWNLTIAKLASVLGIEESFLLNKGYGIPLLEGESFGVNLFSDLLSEQVYLDGGLTALENEEAVNKIKRLADLTERQESVIHFIYMEGKTVKEIAQMLKVEEQRIYQLRNRALQKLRNAAETMKILDRPEADTEPAFNPATPVRPRVIEREKFASIFEIRVPKRYTRPASEAINERIANFVIKIREVLGEKEEFVEGALNELALNFMDHADGGIIRVYAEKDDSGAVSKLIISAQDNGPGLGKDPNDLIRADLEVMLDKKTSDRSRGFLVITFLPDDIKFKYGGNEWTRVSRDINAAEWYKKTGDIKTGSDNAQGTEWSLEFNLGPDERAVDPLGSVMARPGDEVNRDVFIAPDTAKALDATGKPFSTDMAKEKNQKDDLLLQKFKNAGYITLDAEGLPAPTPKLMTDIKRAGNLGKLIFASNTYIIRFDNIAKEAAADIISIYDGKDEYQYKDYADAVIQNAPWIEEDISELGLAERVFSASWSFIPTDANLMRLIYHRRAAMDREEQEAIIADVFPLGDVPLSVAASINAELSLLDTMPWKIESKAVEQLVDRIRNKDAMQKDEAVVMLSMIAESLADGKAVCEDEYVEALIEDVLKNFYDNSPPTKKIKTPIFRRLKDFFFDATGRLFDYIKKSRHTAIAASNSISPTSSVEKTPVLKRSVAGDMDAVEAFLANLGYDPLASIGDFKRMLKRWSDEKLADGSFSLNANDIAAFYGKVENNIGSLKNVLLKSLNICNAIAPSKLEQVHGLLETLGIGKKITHKVFKAASPDPHATIALMLDPDTAGTRADYRLGDADFDENGVPLVITFNVAENSKVEMKDVPYYIHILGHLLVHDRPSIQKDILNLNGGIYDNGYIYNLYIDHGEFEAALHERMNYAMSALFSYWLIGELMPHAATLDSIRDLLSTIVAKSDNPATHILGNLPLLCYAIALAAFYGYTSSADLIMIRLRADAISRPDTRKLIGAFESYLSGLSLKMLDKYYWNRLKGDDAVAKREAVTSLRNRLGHDEAQVTADAVYVHDYKSMEFGSYSAAYAALTALRDNPPAELAGIGIDTGHVEVIPIKVETEKGRPETKYAIRLTSQDTKTELLAIPHTTKPMILYHVLRKATLADPSQAEITRILTEEELITQAILDAKIGKTGGAGKQRKDQSRDPHYKQMLPPEAGSPEDSFNRQLGLRGTGIHSGVSLFHHSDQISVLDRQVAGKKKNGAKSIPEYAYVDFASVNKRYKAGLSTKIKSYTGKALVNKKGVPEIFYLNSPYGPIEVSVITERALDGKHYPIRHNILDTDGIMTISYPMALRRVSDMALINSKGQYVQKTVDVERKKYGDDILLENTPLKGDGRLSAVFTGDRIYIGKEYGKRRANVYITSSMPFDKIVFSAVSGKPETTLEVNWETGVNIDTGEEEYFIVSQTSKTAGNEPRTDIYKRVYKKMPESGSVLVYSSIRYVPEEIIRKAGDCFIRGLDILSIQGQYHYVWLAMREFKIPNEYSSGMPEIEWDVQLNRPKSITVEFKEGDTAKVELTPQFDEVWKVAGDSASGFSFSGEKSEQIVGFKAKEFSREGVSQEKPYIALRKGYKTIGEETHLVYAAGAIMIFRVAPLGEVTFYDIPVFAKANESHANVMAGERLDLPVEFIRYKECDVTIGKDNRPGLDGKVTHLRFHAAGERAALEVDVTRLGDIITDFKSEAFTRSLKLIWSNGPEGSKLAGSCFWVTQDLLNSLGSDLTITGIESHAYLKIGSNNLYMPYRLQNRPAVAHAQNGVVDYVTFPKTDTEPAAVLKIDYEEGFPFLPVHYTIEIEGEEKEETEFLRAYDRDNKLVVTSVGKNRLTITLKIKGFTGTVKGPLYTDEQGVFNIGGKAFVGADHPNERVDVRYFNGTPFHVIFPLINEEIGADLSLESLFQENIGLIYNTLQPYVPFARYLRLDIEDFIETTGIDALLKAITTFDKDIHHSQDALIAECAVEFARNYMYTASNAKAMKLSESDFWYYVRLYNIEMAAIMSNGGEITDEELAAKYLYNAGVETTVRNIDKNLPKITHRKTIFQRLRASSGSKENPIPAEWISAAKIAKPNAVSAFVQADASCKTVNILTTVEGPIKHTIVMLRLIGNLSFKEIASILRVDINRVATLYRAALDEIEKHLTAKNGNSKFPFEFPPDTAAGEDYVSLRRVYSTVRMVDGLPKQLGVYDIVDWSHASYETMQAFTLGGINEAVEDIVEGFGSVALAGLDGIRIMRRVPADEAKKNDIFARYFANEDSKRLEINRRLAKMPQPLMRMVLMHDISHSIFDIYSLGTISEELAELVSIISHIASALGNETPEGHQEIVNALRQLNSESPSGSNEAFIRLHEEIFDAYDRGEFDMESDECALFILERVVGWMKTYLYPGSALLENDIDELLKLSDQIHGYALQNTPAKINVSGAAVMFTPIRLFDDNNMPQKENWRYLILKHPDYAWRIFAKFDAKYNINEDTPCFEDLIHWVFDEIFYAKPGKPEGAVAIEAYANFLGHLELSPDSRRVHVFKINQRVIDRINSVLKITPPDAVHPAELALNNRMVLVGADNPYYQGPPEVVENIIDSLGMHGTAHIAQLGCKGYVEEAAIALENAGKIDELRSILNMPIEYADNIAVVREASADLVEFKYLYDHQPDRADQEFFDNLLKALGIRRLNTDSPAILAYENTIPAVRMMLAQIQRIMSEDRSLPTGVFPHMASQDTRGVTGPDNDENRAIARNDSDKSMPAAPGDEEEKNKTEPVSAEVAAPVTQNAPASESGFVSEATPPIEFLRDIVNPEELTQNMIEGILSALFSNKRPTLAFSKKLKGLESTQLKSLIRQLRAWKETTARKNPKMKVLLDGFTVLEYDDLKTALNEKGIDPDNTANLIFTYEPKPEDDSDDKVIGQAIRPVYIVEPEGGFPVNYYYPLLEMVTISLAKELLHWDESRLKEALVASNINTDTFGIDTTIDERLGILVFKVLPKIERYDNNSRIDRYTRLLQFLRSA